MNNTLSVVILAAGKGTRMYSKWPKVLHPIAQTPMLSRVISTAKSLNFKEIVVVYGHGGELVPTTINDKDVIWALQAEQLGTGHALKMALPHLSASDRTLVLYGDVPLTSVDTLQQLVSASSKGMSVLTDILEDANGYGRIKRDENGHAIAIVEHKDCDAKELKIREINTGMMCLPTAKLELWLSTLKNSNAQGEYYLTDVLALAVQEKLSVETVTVKNSWEAAGVNNKVQLAELERVYQNIQAENLLLKGVTLLDPKRIDIRGLVTVGQDVQIDVGCVFEGNVVLEDDVKIGPYCVLKNCTIQKGTVLAAYSHIEDALVAQNCKVGPFARLRPGAVLSDNVHVGNFVEIKKSVIGEGSKVNHLTYIGDAQIGKKVNVGAGSVTCNYDGVNKFTTVIEDNVFVGSGTLMVAPVKIESGATIGAGSVITKTAPKDVLTVARARQVSLSAWTRPIKINK